MKRQISLACAACILLVATAADAQAPPAKTGGAGKSVYQAGKKPDDSAGGCSTPTDAKSAGVDPKAAESTARTGAKKNRTVCTTAGSEGVGAIDKKKKAEPKKNASANDSTSSKPR